MEEGVLSVNQETKEIRELPEERGKMEFLEIGVLLEVEDPMEKWEKMDHLDYQDEWDQLEKLVTPVCKAEKEKLERMRLYQEIYCVDPQGTKEIEDKVELLGVLEDQEDKV